MLSTRYNSRGVEYAVFGSDNAKQTTIKLAGSTRQIVVSFNPRVIDACWHEWTYNHKMIQQAFPMLSANEREFLMTGMTQEEFNEATKSEEEF